MPPASGVPPACASGGCLRRAPGVRPEVPRGDSGVPGLKGWRATSKTDLARSVANTVPCLAGFSRSVGPATCHDDAVRAAG